MPIIAHLYGKTLSKNLICTLFTGQSVKEGVFMKYSDEKLELISKVIAINAGIDRG